MSKWTVLKRSTNDNEIYEEMLNTLSHKKCHKSKLHWDSISPQSVWQSSRKQTSANPDEGTGKRDTFYTVIWV
jgi:hypothetical protein